MTHIPRPLTICDLPDEIILEIFGQLSPAETQTLIYHLTNLLDQTSITSIRLIDNVKFLIKLSYIRLYKGKSLILSNEPNDDTYSEYDTVLTFDKFKNKLYSDNGIDQEVFKETRPKLLDFKLIRNANDYINFVGDLSKLNQIIDELLDGGEISNYFELVCQLGFYLDGNTISIESPTSLLTAILKTFINLVSKNIDTNSKGNEKAHFLSEKFQSFTIKSTDIGNYYTSQWGQLLGRFTNLTTLNLSDNIIKSDKNQRFQGAGDQSTQVDIIGNYFTWPPRLKSLSLDKNLISYITKKLIKNLPQTLEILLIENNRLCSLGCSELEYFNIAQDLPNLTTLNLTNNYLLIFINCAIFDNVAICGGKFKTLFINGCNVDENNLQQLKEKLSKESIYVSY